MSELIQRIEKIEQIIEGNGQAGLKTKVAVIEENLKCLQDIKDRLDQLTKWGFAALGALGFIQLLPTIITVLKIKP